MSNVLHYNSIFEFVHPRSEMFVYKHTETIEYVKKELTF